MASEGLPRVVISQMGARLGYAQYEGVVLNKCLSSTSSNGQAGCLILFPKMAMRIGVVIGRIIRTRESSYVSEKDCLQSAIVTLLSVKTQSG